MGAEGTEGTEEDEGAFIHVVRWLGHHGKRLYGFMGLRSKMLEWTGLEWIPLRLLRLLEHLRC